MGDKPWTRFLLACEHIIGCYDRNHPAHRSMFCDECMAWQPVLREVGLAEAGRRR